jgi:hypothetical protein
MSHMYYKVTIYWTVDYTSMCSNKKQAFNYIFDYVNGGDYLTEGYPRTRPWYPHLEVVYNIDRSDKNSVSFPWDNKDGYVYEVIDVNREKIIYKCYLIDNADFQSFKRRHSEEWQQLLIENIKFNVTNSCSHIKTHNEVGLTAMMRVTDVEVEKYGD